MIHARTLRQRGLALSLAAMLASGFAVAEQMQRFGDFEAHYVVFPSTFLQSEIAQQYGLRRGAGLAILNLSVLDAAGKGTACAIVGHSKNLLGQISPLTLKEVREGDAIYYLAEVRHADQEVLRFSLTLTPPDAKPFTLSFQQRLHAEE